VIEALEVLAKRLRDPPPSEESSGKPDFCCHVAAEEERLRPKRPEEILPIIQKLKLRWQRADVPGPSSAQLLIDDLWADMIPHGWTMPACPKLASVPTLAYLTNRPAHENLWREYHAALSQAEKVVKEQTAQSIANLKVTGQDWKDSSSPASGASEPHENLCQTPPNTTEPIEFTGGTMKFFEDRVELCGVDICSGHRAKTRRQILDLLRVKRRDGKFESYGGEVLATLLKLDTGSNTVAGAIRDLRDGIVQALKSQANTTCGRQDVVVSGGPGYRLADCITVQEGDQPGITDIGKPGDVRNVRDHDVPNVRNEDDSEDSAGKRRAWILHRLVEGEKLQAPIVAEQFKCSVKTAQRDLQALKEEGSIDFYGAPRTGYYRLRKPLKGG
jgi:hypothetical protein